MTHSQQPSIDILNKWLNKTGVEPVNKDDNNFIIWWAYHLEKARKEILSLPQEPTTEELLEEMPTEWFELIKDDEWYRASYMSFWFASWRWNTPREALLALKEKLNSNI